MRKQRLFHSITGAKSAKKIRYRISRLEKEEPEISVNFDLPVQVACLGIIVIIRSLANWSSKLNKTAIEDSLETAFKAWSAYSRLSFEATSNATAADISVLFGKYQHGDGHPFDGPGRVLAHAFYPYDSGRLGGDLHFDEDESWTLGVEAKSHETDFFTVALHEIGHALGLAHSPDQTSVMFPYYQANKNEFALGYDDILAMYELYSKYTFLLIVPNQYNKVITNDPVQNFDGPETEQTTSTATTTTTTTTTTSSSKTFSTTIMPTDDRWQNDEGYENRNASNICSGLQLDTIVNLRGELFAFRDKLMWRFIERGHLREQYPAEFTQMFPALNADKIDAVYETNEGNIVFFSGSKYWVYDGYQFSDDSPRMISQLGLTDVGKIDAVFVWPKNGRTYVFSGQKYWKLNEAQTYTEDGYPLLIRDRWQNVPDLLDAIFAWKDGKTYIFKGKHFYELDDRKIYAEISSESTVHHWFGC